MSDQTLLELAKDALDHAEEILTRAEASHDAHTRQKLLEIAMKYEKLAEQLEQAARRRSLS